MDAYGFYHHSRTCQLRFFFTESRTNNDITGNYVGTNWVEEDFLKKGLDVY